MTTEEKKIELTRRVKRRLDNMNYRIYDIASYYMENTLTRDMSKRDVIITNFTETILESTVSVISDPETLEMLYVRTGPMNFVDIEEFFNG